jgi:hypothetical protein
MIERTSSFLNCPRWPEYQAESAVVVGRVLPAVPGPCADPGQAVLLHAPDLGVLLGEDCAQRRGVTTPTPARSR